MMPNTRLILLTIILLPATAHAAMVEMLQPPAWVIRAETQTPMTHDTELQSGDIIRTGPRARVRIGLAEGSDIRVGPLGRVELPRLEAPEDEGGLFQGLVDVVKGAFRFTTGQVGADRRREFEFSVGAVTIGVRGTDFWGKSAEDRDFVVLLEGAIDVGSGDRTTRLEQPGHAYIQPRDGAARSGVPIPRETIAEYARETKRLESRGALTPDGDWQTMLDSLRDGERARTARERYREAGYPVTIERVSIDGQRWHRIVLPGGATRADARALADEFERDFGVRGAWVRRAGAE